MLTQTAIRTAIIGAALVRLGVIAAGETAAAADQALVSNSLDRLLDHLADAAVTDFDKGAIPETAQKALIDLLAAELADDYGLTPPQQAGRAAAANAARLHLLQQRRVASSAPVTFGGF